MSKISFCISKPNVCLIIPRKIQHFPFILSPVLSTSPQKTPTLPDFLVVPPIISLNKSFFPFCIKPPYITVELEDVGLSVYRLLVDQYIKLTACQKFTLPPSQPTERK